MREWRGKLELTYGYDDGSQPGGSPRGTAITHSYTQAPLRLQRAFYPEGPERCQSVIIHTAGGMVGGDHLDIHLRLAPQAQAQVTTAAAAKIYRSNGQTARQTVVVHVGAGACLEWLPQETILFNQAQYRQQMSIVLEPGAQWLGWEVTRLGRTARGEQFVAGDWRSRTLVQQQLPQEAHGIVQRPLWIDRQWLPGSPETWASPHGLNSCPVIGSFAWLGAIANDQMIEDIRAKWLGLAAPPTDSGGVTRLSQGLLCRYRGHSTSLANRWFRQVWQLIRTEQSGLPAQVPRVWQH